MKSMRAVVISVGTELISGQTVDSNIAYLSRKLAEHGIETDAHFTVGDNLRDIADAISLAAGRAEVVIVTGGLGPTVDDMTRQALADAMGVELVTDTRSLDRIEKFFARRGWKMSDVNRVQAMVPAGAKAIDNDMGTAPGIAASIGRSRIFLLPGVPMEMEAMFANGVCPLLPAAKGVVLRHEVHVFGKGESDIGAAVADLMRLQGAVTVGITVHAGMVSLRIASRAADEITARRQIRKIADEIRARLGELVVGEGDDTLSSAVGESLKKRGQTLATAESCTGGFIGKLITDTPGSSSYYLGGAVVYSNKIKSDLLFVEPALIESHGAVSEEVATAMAAGCRRRFGSDWAISVTGIAGPAGGTAEKPVGLVYIAIASPDGGVEVHKNIFPGTREIVRLRTSQFALNLVRLALLKK